VLPLSQRLRTIALLEQQVSRIFLQKREAQKRLITRKLILEMRDLCQSKGVPFVLALLMATDDAKRYYRALCRVQQINLVDCSHWLTPQTVVPGEGHPNGKLNATWATELAAALGPRFRAIELGTQDHR
jgi:hypothetical protein